MSLAPRGGASSYYGRSSGASAGVSVNRPGSMPYQRIPGMPVYGVPGMRSSRSAPKPAAPAPAAAPSKPYVNPFAAQPAQQQPAQQQGPEAPPWWAVPPGGYQPFQSTPPPSPGYAPAPLPAPDPVSVNVSQRQPAQSMTNDPGEGWDESGENTIAPGLGQRHLPDSMSALASASRLY